jgi:hypothetical protein
LQRSCFQVRSHAQAGRKGTLGFQPIFFAITIETLIVGFLLRQRLECKSFLGEAIPGGTRESVGREKGKEASTEGSQELESGVGSSSGPMSLRPLSAGVE